MTHREVFLRINAFEPVDWVPNYELGAWGQAFERWVGEGMPDTPEAVCNWFNGAPFFGLMSRGFAPVITSMMPGFEYEVIEETERYLIARGGDGHRDQGAEGGDRPRHALVHGRVHRLSGHRPRLVPRAQASLRPRDARALPGELGGAEGRSGPRAITRSSCRPTAPSASIRNCGRGWAHCRCRTCSTTTRR